MELQKYPEALDAHQHALDIDAQFHKAWVNMGIVHRKMGDLDRAEQCYRKAMEIKPNYAELHTSLGALYIHRDQPEKAIPELQEAIRLDPTVAVTYGNLALAYAMVGRFAEAEKALKTSVVKGYKNHQLVKDRIEALKKIG